MATFRIRAEFDLEVLDDAAALETARQFMVQRIDAATMNGASIRTGTAATPAEAFDDVLSSPPALASLMATVMMTRGAAGVQEVKCTNLAMQHVDPLAG